MPAKYVAGRIKRLKRAIELTRAMSGELEREQTEWLESLSREELETLIFEPGGARMCGLIGCGALTAIRAYLRFDNSTAE